MGGFLANPVESYPNVFGDGSVLGGKHGVGWMKRWPYALPNLMSAILLFSAALCLLFGLEEVGDGSFVQLCLLTYERTDTRSSAGQTGHWPPRHKVFYTSAQVTVSSLHRFES